MCRSRRTSLHILNFFCILSKKSHEFSPKFIMLIIYIINSLLSQRSAIELEVIVIDNDTKDMLEAINFKDLPCISVQAVSAQRS